SSIPQSSPALLGYAYSALPSPVTFTVSPTYYISSVIYVPPGQGPSTVTYGTGSMTGTTLSTTQTWSSDSSFEFGLSLGSMGNTVGFGFSLGDSFGGSTTQSTDVQATYSQNTTYRGPTSNALNHDYDQILLFLGVKLNASVNYLGQV